MVMVFHVKDNGVDINKMIRKSIIPFYAIMFQPEKGVNIMQTIQIEIKDTLYSDIIKSGINIQSEFSQMIEKTVLKRKKNLAFGILKNRVKDPVEWQRELREENDRDIYSEYKL